MKFKVYIVDDHQLIIDGLSLLIRDSEEFIFVGSANDGEEAIKDIVSIKPDVVLLDISLTLKTNHKYENSSLAKDGIQVLKYLKIRVDSKFIIVSMSNDKKMMTECLNHGADGYLLKNTGREELLKTLKLVLEGFKYFPILKEKSQEVKIFLTPREMDVLKLVLSEKTSQEIAEELKLSPFTVDTHRKNINKKTGTKNITGLMKFAAENSIFL